MTFAAKQAVASPGAPSLGERSVKIHMECSNHHVLQVHSDWQRLPVELLWIGSNAQTIETHLRRTVSICLQAHLAAAACAIENAQYGSNPRGVNNSVPNVGVSCSNGVQNGIDSEVKGVVNVVGKAVDNPVGNRGYRGGHKYRDKCSDNCPDKSVDTRGNNPGDITGDKAGDKGGDKGKNNQGDMLGNRLGVNSGKGVEKGVDIKGNTLVHNPCAKGVQNPEGNVCKSDQKGPILASSASLEQPRCCTGDVLWISSQIALETARDTLRRYLLDYPGIFGGNWPSEVFSAWRGLTTTEALRSFCEQYIWGMTPEQWLGLGDREMGRWIEQAGTKPALWLRQSFATELVARKEIFCVDIPGWARQWAQPLLAGGPLPHCPPHALSQITVGVADLPTALLLHRLQYLAHACLHNVQKEPQFGGACYQGIGLGWAHTARGTLIHLAKIEDQKVVAYRIVPPTQINTAPGSLLTRVLKGVHQDNALRVAHQLMALLDPCAPLEITLSIL